MSELNKKEKSITKENNKKKKRSIRATKLDKNGINNETRRAEVTFPCIFL